MNRRVFSLRIGILLGLLLALTAGFAHASTLSQDIHVVSTTPATPTPTVTPIVIRTITTSVATTAPTGAVSVGSTPPGATVTIDGTSLGTTPFTLRTLPGGTHTLVLHLDGYEDVTDTLTIIPDSLVTRTYTLEPVTTVPTETSAIRVVTPVQTATTGQTVTTVPTLQTAAPVTTTLLPATGSITPVTTVTTSAPVLPVQTPVKAAGIPNLCQYNAAAGTCGGTCPLTGETCQITSASACGTGTTASQCGCVDTKSGVSMTAAGLAHAGTATGAPARNEVKPPAQDLVGSMVSAITGIFHQKPDMSRENASAYTRATTQSAALFAGNCTVNPFRTLLVFTSPAGSFVDTSAKDTNGYFVWDSADPRITSVVWQVSLFPFPESLDNWTEVPGLIAQGNLEGNEHRFAIDFSKSTPSGAEMASAWAAKKPFLTLQKNALVSIKTQAVAVPAQAASGTSATLARMDTATIDTAVSRVSAALAQPSAVTLKAPSGKVATVSAGVPSQVSAATGTKYTIKSGVSAPVLNNPALTKIDLAGTLPQSQRTFYVRVLPFDASGNYTGNPSNPAEVVAGDPLYNTTGPWSGWDALSQAGLTGPVNTSAVVSFGGKTFFFEVRNSHISVNAIDDSGAATGWSEVPGSFVSDPQIAAVTPGTEISTWPQSPHLYLFATSVDPGAAYAIWYTQMDESGSWDSWKPVPQADPSLHYTLDGAAVTNTGRIILLAERPAQKHLNSNTQTYTTVPPAIDFQIMTGASPTESWGKDWYSPDVTTDGLTRYLWGGSFGQLGNFLVLGRQENNGQLQVLLYNTPSVTPSGSTAAPQPSMPLLSTIDIPASVAGTGTGDLAATLYHGRLYLFARGSDGHIRSASMTVNGQYSNAGYFGDLSGWEDVTDGLVSGHPGITAITSEDGNRLDLYSDDVTQLQAGSGNPLSFLAGLFGFGPSPVLYHATLGSAPATTQVLASYTGNRMESPDTPLYGYITRDVNMSWTRHGAYWFAWNSSQPGTAYAEWQVSTVPFDEITPVYDSPGIVAHGRLNASATDPDYIVRETSAYSPQVLPSYLAGAHRFPVDFNAFATATDPAHPSVTRYYLRVISVTSGKQPGEFVASASRQIEADWGPEQQYTPDFCSAPTYYTYTYQIPQIKITGYTPIQKQADDYYCHGIVTTGYEYWLDYFKSRGYPDGDASSMTSAEYQATLMSLGHHYGDKIDLCSQPKSNWYDWIIELYQLITSFFETIVDGISDTYSQVKAAVIAEACGNNPTCESLVSAGVDSGLAALGVPPTLPNFNELTSEGVDYLAATVADESGVPLSDDATKQLVQQISDGLKNVPNPNDSLGIQPDPAYEYQPARLQIELVNPDPVNATVPGEFGLTDSNDLFKTAQTTIPFPSVQPGQTIMFPLVLKEDQWKGMTCTESLGDGDTQYPAPCDQVYQGQFNSAWWTAYSGGSGDRFVIYYEGLPANFTESLTQQLSLQYGVPLNAYGQAVGAMDYQKADCHAAKYGLVFKGQVTGGKTYSSYAGYGADPIDVVYLESLTTPWSG